MRSKETKCDVVIIGAGMAGGCLARQLRLQQPDLKIVNIERKAKFDWWVGESTVEAWDDYMTRVLRLGAFVEKNFIQKHGLRHFFDSPEKDLTLAEMSEFGRTSYQPLPAREVDRSLFDSKMAKMNKAMGVDVRLGTAVLEGEDGIVLDKDQGHLVRTTKGTFRCRWLVDAGGPKSPLARKLRLVEPEARNMSASYWGRFSGYNCIDDLGGNEFRARVRYTARYNSTNHFQYPGYWIWHIPLTEDLLSLGVEFNRDKTDIWMRNGDDLVRWLRSHRAIDEIMGPKAKLHDFVALNRLPRCAKRHFSDDRWFLAGMSGLFVDVMGSGTSRLYSETNRLIGRLIATDRSGDRALFESELKHFNLFVKCGYERQLRNLSRYDWYGSYDIWSVFFGANVAKYLNSLVPNGMTDLKFVFDTARRHLDGCDCSFEKYKKEELEAGFSTALYRRTEEFAEQLKKKNAYFLNNRGKFLDFGFWELRPGITSKYYKPRDLEAEKIEDRKLYHDAMKIYASRLCELEGRPFSKAAFDKAFDPDWDSGQTLADLVRSASRRPAKV